MVDPELVAIGAEAPARLTDLGVMPEPGGEGEEPHRRGRTGPGVCGRRGARGRAVPCRSKRPIRSTGARARAIRIGAARPCDRDEGTRLRDRPSALELGAGEALVGDNGEAGEWGLRVDVAVATPDFGGFVLPPRSPPAIWNQSSRPCG